MFQLRQATRYELEPLRSGGARWAMTVFIAVLVLALTAETGADATRNEAGVPWVDSTDNWGLPWGDAASGFYGRLEDQRRALAAQGVATERIEFAVGTESSLRKVFRPKLWFKGDFSGSVKLDAARGEHEAFQLVICPIADSERALSHLSAEKDQGHATFTAKSVSIKAIEMSPLRHVAGEFEIAADRWTLDRVGYVRTVQPQYPVMNVGEWPDPLLPLGTPFEVSNPDCQPVWVEIEVPRDAPSGRYHGQLTVKGPHDVRIAIEVVVRDFALPARPLISMGWSLHAWFGRDGVDMLLKRLEVLLEHRLAPWHTAYGHHGKLEDHDRVMAFLLERGVRLQATSGKPPAEFVAHLREKGWLKHYITLWGDEPHERDYPTYRQRTEEIHRDYPGLTVAMTEEPGPHNRGLFDLWIAEPTAQKDAWVRDAIERGDRVWWYLCQLPIHAEFDGPIHACPGMVVDRPAIDHRITYWFAFRQGIEGVSYWAVSKWPAGFEKWPAEPWPVNPISKFPYSGQHNANGFLCYPGSDGMPWPSIRLKCMRDGLEDQEYLSLLRAGAGSSPSPTVRRLLDVPPELAIGLRYYNKDPRVLLDVRRQVADAIEGLQEQFH